MPESSSAPTGVDREPDPCAAGCPGPLYHWTRPSAARRLKNSRPDRPTPTSGQRQRRPRAERPILPRPRPSSRAHTRTSQYVAAHDAVANSPAPRAGVNGVAAPVLQTQCGIIVVNITDVVVLPRAGAEAVEHARPEARRGAAHVPPRRPRAARKDIKQTRFRWSRSLPLFLAVVAVSGLAIFNYQKTSSPIVSSTLYALRTSPRARALLGDDIYFKQPIPWIRGEMNQLQGRIDIYFSVRGSRGAGVMRFASYRPSSRSLFETTEWSLKMDDGGDWVDLLEDGDPFRSLLNDDAPPVVRPVVEEPADLNATRGFRQQGALNK
ncbi:cytochrome oxidase assembly [Purpureocillium lilacinum]|uniref:Cytochrome oxidase assembly n=1 Tax=Purpureocillium lilacinum TaxID=33203 RepID=A0A2U3EGM9_PURLI|nr:cytochrome oxidase assembly [Purpureocillium lilacinum]